MIGTRNVFTAKSNKNFDMFTLNLKMTKLKSKKKMIKSIKQKMTI